MKKRKVKSWKKICTLLVGVLLLGTMIIFLPKQPLNFGFLVKKIICEEISDSGEVFPCKSERKQLFEQFYDKNIFFLKSTEVAQIAQEFDHEIQQVEVKKKLPQTLIVRISQRQGAICLSVDEKEFFLIDETGVIVEGPIKARKCYNLLLIILPNIWEPKVGLRFSNYPALQNALLLAKILQDFFINFEKIIIEEEGDLKLVLSDRTLAFFSGEKDLKAQVASLQLILKQAKMKAPFLQNEKGPFLQNEEDKIIKQIDLRFEKPVLKFR